MSTSDIERESLDAHVELCGERYKQLHDKLDAVNHRLDEKVESINTRLDKQESTLQEIKTAVANSDNNRSNQVSNWAFLIIVLLLGGMGGLVIYILNLIQKVN